MKARFTSAQRHYLLPAVLAAATTVAAVSPSFAGDEHDQRMTLHSATFADGGTLPLSMISTWRHAPPDTRSFIVIAYDVTAQFTHWQMYNIPADTTSLPQNAGTPGSVYGIESGNDFFQPNYSGPCPPPNLAPHAHKYEFTVYALDRFLPVVHTFGDFVPAGPEGLYQELIEASRHGHVLASATIAGFFSAADGK